MVGFGLKLTLVIVSALSCACGPRVLGVEDADSEGGGDGAATACSVSDGAAEARVVIGEGGIASIEVLTTGVAEAEPLSCDDRVDGCGYELHRLFPLEGIAVGELSVAADDMLHEVEYCSCCNGEGGGPDESHGSYHFSAGAMTIDTVGEVCVIGSFVAPGGVRLDFVAELCDR